MESKLGVRKSYLLLTPPEMEDIKSLMLNYIGESFKTS